MIFEFNKQLMPQNLVEIDEVGEFGLEASNDEGYFYYLVIRTLLGTTTIATCGPIIPDIEMLPSGFKMTLDKMPFKEDKLAKTISFFLNDTKKGITQARVISIDEAIKQFRELKDYLINFSEDTF